MDMTSVDLDSLGLLKATQIPKNYEWLNDEDKVFMLTLMMAGTEGISRRDAYKEEKRAPDILLRLEAHGLTTWERDQRGKLSFYCLTWKGQELAELLLQIAKNKSHKRD